MLSNIKINHISYDWRDIEIHFIGDLKGSVGISGLTNPTGSKVTTYQPSGVSSINYNINHVIDYDYSRDGFKVGRKFGKYETDADITLDYYEIKTINNKLFKIGQGLHPIDIKIVYNTTDGTYIDTLYGCVLNFQDSNGGNQGDIGLEATIKLNPVWIHTGFIIKNK